MYSFEGNYKRGLNQSLGRKNTVDKQSVLMIAQEKRMRRVHERLRETSCVIIQATWRSYCVRKQQIIEKKSSFRDGVKSFQVKSAQNDSEKSSQLHLLLRQLVFFYRSSDKQSHKLLVDLCKISIQHHSAIILQIVEQPSYHRVLLSNFLKIVCSLLEGENGRENQTSSVLLRTLEIYTDKQNYKSIDTLKHIMAIISVQGYFRSMYSVCKRRIPESITYSSHPPTPISSSLLKLILNPLLLCTQAVGLLDHHIINSFVSVFMADSEPSIQVENFIIPALSETDLPLTALITVLTQHKKTDLSIYTLYSLLSLVNQKIISLSVSTCIDYIILISDLSLSLNSTYYLPGDMDWTDQNSQNVESRSSRCCEIINSPSHVDTILTLTKSLNSSQNSNHIQSETDSAHMETNSSHTDDDSSHNTIQAICQLCYGLLYGMRKSVHSQRLLYTLAFNKNFLTSLYRHCITAYVTNSTGSRVSLIQIVSRGLSDSVFSDDHTQQSVHKLKPLLATFTNLYYHCCLTLHDNDFKITQDEDTSNPFTTSELISMISTLRDLCLGIIHFALPDTRPVFEDRREFLQSIGLTVSKNEVITKEEYQKQKGEWVYMFMVTAKLTKQLYSRDLQTKFCPAGHWLSNSIQIQAIDLDSIYKNAEEIFEFKPLTDDIDELLSLHMTMSTCRRLVVLTEIPFVVTFKERVQILTNLLRADKDNYQDGFMGSSSRDVINVNVRRDYLYEDSFEKLSPENEPTIKSRFVVMMRNAVGLDEIGIDGGGIFREFLSELIKTGFDPNRGIFVTTEDRQLYPNPDASHVMENYLDHFFFLGRMLGKALYENMLVELPMADFFMSKILGKTESDFHQLSSLDPQLYKNLLFVKNYEGDISELGLFFTISTNVLGVNKQIDLKANGSNIQVDNSNRIEYVHLVADYKLNKQIRTQCRSFTSGISDVIKLEWLRMFDFQELRVMISGATTPINVEDLRKHTVYSGNYTDDHPTIHLFWTVVESLNHKQRSQLLKFVTSCSRPPLLGFKELIPAFCIHYGGSEPRLPTASTCMNFLKLPEFKDEEILRQKLLYAIESESGFELS